LATAEGKQHVQVLSHYKRGMVAEWMRAWTSGAQRSQEDKNIYHD